MCIRDSATATEAIADASTGEKVIVVSYAADKTDPIVLNKAVDLTVNTGVTVPEIRLEALSGQNTGAYKMCIRDRIAGGRFAGRNG